MVRQYEGSSTFRFTWDKLVKAYWCRYPNPESKHVLTEDVLTRCVDSAGRLWSKRLISKTNPCPKWAEKLISVRSLFVVEESIVDPKTQTLTTYTRNIGCTNYMTVDEKVVYRVSPENHSWTVAERTAWVSSSYGYGLSRAVEAFGLDRFRKNVKKACYGFQMVLDAMYSAKGIELISNHHTFHPLLMERLRAKAKNLTDAAKATTPLVVTALSESR